MRLFLAVNPPDPWRHELSRRVDDLRTVLGPERALRWVKPEAWHLTLMFLGDWPGERLAALEDGLAGGVAAPAFRLRAGQPGAFPGWKRPRVLFLHQDSGGAAEELAGQVRQAVSGVWPEGPRDGKSFRAHLTLARIKGVPGRMSLGAMREWRCESLPPWPVAAFHLMSSELKSTGAVHEVVASFPLSGPESGP